MSARLLSLLQKREQTCFMEEIRRQKPYGFSKLEYMHKKLINHVHRVLHG